MLNLKSGSNNLVSSSHGHHTKHGDHMVMEYQRNIGSMKMETVMGNILVILVSQRNNN